LLAFSFSGAGSAVPARPFSPPFWLFNLFISCYPDWAGISSYGNRFFVSLSPLFILGLAVFFDRAAQLFRSQRAALSAAITPLAVTTLWNAGVIFQWGSGPVSFSEMAYTNFSLSLASSTFSSVEP